MLKMKFIFFMPTFLTSNEKVVVFYSVVYSKTKMSDLEKEFSTLKVEFMDLKYKIDTLSLQEKHSKFCMQNM